MGGLLATIFSMVFNWNRREFRRFRNCALALTVPPIGMLLGAAALGEFGWRYKLVAVEFEMLLVMYAAIVFGWRRFLFGVELGTFLAAPSPAPSPAPRAGGRSSLASIRVSVDNYFQLVAAVIASEAAAGFIVLWLPLHSDPALSLLALPISMAFIAYWVWQKGATWWPWVVLWLTCFTLVAGLVGLLAPYLMPETTRLAVSHRGAPDASVVAFLRGDATPLTALWVTIVLLLVVQVGAHLFQVEAQPTARWAGRILVAMLLVTWFVSGSGSQWFGIDHAASAIPGVHRISVPLRGSGQWVDVSDHLPGCTRVVHKTYLATGPRIRFGRSTPQPLLEGVEFGRIKYPIEVDGGGKVIFELSEIGKKCT